jgi:hypothetical protein
MCGFLEVLCSSLNLAEEEGWEECESRPPFHSQTEASPQLSHRENWATCGRIHTVKICGAPREKGWKDRQLAVIVREAMVKNLKAL